MLTEFFDTPALPIKNLRVKVLQKTVGLPFYIAMEEEDPEVLEIVEQAFSIIERLTSVKIPRIYVKPYLHEGDWGSVKWYVKNSWDSERNQVNYVKLWKLFEKEPWQKQERHYELMILERDLYYPGTNFIFGGTNGKVTNSGKLVSDRYVLGIVISLFRIRRWYKENYKDVLLAILLHELGHFFGLPPEWSPDYIKRGSPKMKNELDEGHCDRRDCIMEQVNVHGRPDVLKKSFYVQENNPNFFCRNCLEALKANVKRLYA